jgi:hypothetical protein
MNLEAAAVTVSATAAEADESKSVLPPYFAVSERVPGARALDEGEQLPLPAVKVTLHRVVPPATTVTVPVGVPVYSGVVVTLNLSVCSLP